MTSPKTGDAFFAASLCFRFNPAAAAVRLPQEHFFPEIKRIKCENMINKCCIVFVHIRSKTTGVSDLSKVLVLFCFGSAEIFTIFD